MFRFTGIGYYIITEKVLLRELNDNNYLEYF